MSTRSIRQHSLAFLFAVLLITPAAAQTEVSNADAARMLRGNHLFSLQWISWDYFGNARVTRRANTYSIKGEQRGRKNDDFVTIEGTITRIDKLEFAMSGTIVTKVSHINGGEACRREGEFIFRITGNRRYWRLQQMENPCDPVTDYVDIFFR